MRWSSSGDATPAALLPIGPARSSTPTPIVIWLSVTPGVPPGACAQWRPDAPDDEAATAPPPCPPPAAPLCPPPAAPTCPPAPPLADCAEPPLVPAPAVDPPLVPPPPPW